MRALFASPLGFLIGLSLGALGGGGSILAVPALVYGAGLDPRAATSGSLMLVGTAALVGVVPHWRAGRVRVPTGLLFALCAIPGAVAGSAVNERLDPNLLLLAFAGLVLVAAWRMLIGCPTCTRVGEQRSLGRSAPEEGSLVTKGVRTRQALEVRTIVTVLVAGTAVGFLTGLFGVGGGFVIVPALVLVLKLPMPQAIGTSLLVIALNSAVGLTTRLATTTIDWWVTLPFTAAAIAGVLTGAKVADRLDPERSLRVFAVLLVAVAAYTAVSAGLELV
jgi:uncharacterized membrane protein YfcA